MKDDSLEIHRKQQLESSNRINEYSIKTGELSAEISQLKEQIALNLTNKSSEYSQCDQERSELQAQV